MQATGPCAWRKNGDRNGGGGRAFTGCPRWPGGLPAGCGGSQGRLLATQQQPPAPLRATRFNPCRGRGGKKMKFFYMNKRGIQHASSDVGMIFTAYNLRRTFNIIDINPLKAYLKGLGHYYWLFQRPFKAIFRHSRFLSLEPEFLCTF